MKYIQPRTLDIQKYNQVVDTENHVTIGDFENNRIHPRECHENAFIFLEAMNIYQHQKLTPSELSSRLMVVESALKQCINAITGNDPFEDERGVVYKQEFGIAFVNRLNKALDPSNKPLFMVAEKLPFTNVLRGLLDYGEEKTQQLNQRQQQRLISRAIKVYRKCKAAGKVNLAQKISDKYNLGNPSNSLR
jgi:hypothetical protein